MKALALVLTLYCLAAILAIAATGVYFGRELVRLRGQLPAARQAHDTTAQARRDAQLNYTQLAQQQQDERLDYSGADAIRMSHRVQRAQQAFTQASDAARAAADQLADLQQRISRRQLQYVPLGGVLLLHVIGLLIFWPWRERRGPKPAG